MDMTHQCSHYPYDLVGLACTMSDSPTSDSSSKRSTAGGSHSNSSSGRSSRSLSMNDSSSRRLSNDLLELTVNSSMEGVPGTKVLVPPLCRVADLKSIISDATDVQADKQLLLYNDVELKDESSTISSYGIKKDCNITLNVKMSTGSKVARSHANMSMLFMPLVMQQGNLPNLRNTIKQMTTVRSRPVYRGKVDPSKEYSTNWTPAKQMEHELTRNRMRRLLRKRSKKHILSDTSPKEYSPRPGSPTVSDSTSATSSSKSVQTPPSYETTLTEKQLKVFYDPPESLEELTINSNNLTLPPTNMKELLRIRANIRASSKTNCQFCNRKLALTEQHIQCLCEQRFCKKHRLPSAHHCSIDYKQAGRSKIIRENPKVSEGGYHKARQE